MYFELHAASAFSFLEGASTPETLIQHAAELGLPGLALLDRDGLYGAPRVHQAARAAGLKAIVGAELTMRSGDGGAPQPPKLWRLPVLVASRDGYRRLCRLITRMKLRAAKGEGTLTLDDLEGETGGLVALAGRAALDTAHYGVGGLLDRVVGAFGRENVYVEVQRHGLRDEEADNQALLALAAAYHVPVVATNGVRFAAAADRPLFDVLTCVRHGTTLERAGRRLAWNAERHLKSPAAMAELFADLPHAVAATRELADRLAYSMADLGYRFPDYPVPAGETQSSFLRRIAEVGARDRYRPYHDRARAQVTRELDLIEKLDLAGYFLIVWDIVNFCRQHGILVQGRGSAANSAVCYSLGITAVDPVGMGLLFERFLSEERGEWPDIDLDLPSGDRREQVIQYLYQRYGTHGAAMTANVITYRGRSAAREVGKALSLDPAAVDRLAKVLMPFEWNDAADSLVRQLDAVGLDSRDHHVRLFADLWRRMQDLPRHLGQHSGGMVVCQGRLDEVVPLEPASMPGRVVIQWDKEDCADMGIVKVDLLGLGMMAVLQDALAIVNGSTRADDPRSLTGSVDSGQWAVDSERPADTAEGAPPWAPGDGASDVGAAPRAGHQGRDSGQWPVADGQSARAQGARREAQGHDAPSQLRVSSDEFRAPDARDSQLATRHSHGVPLLDLAHLPPDDPDVYRVLQEADTIGVFQVESRAQMATLPRIKPTHFYDLVVEVAIIRPGPIVGQMVHPYIDRRNGRAPVEYPHPSLEPILERTLGVPLFQEQLLRIAMVAAGFSGGEAEELRRAMGFKRSEARMRQIETKLRAGMARNGIEGDAADAIVRSITSFALYGFPESHAASFALLVYASAYLKVHYPAAFYAALLDNQPMGFYHPATLVKDAQRRGVRFAPIDVQVSDWRCRVEPDGRIRLGLMYVRGLREEVAQRMAATPAAVPAPRAAVAPRCPGCGATDRSMLEMTARRADEERWFCNVCARQWSSGPDAAAARARFRSLDHFAATTGVRRDELATLAEIGALNSFGHDRRSALWQVEQVVRPAGELFAGAVDSGQWAVDSGQWAVDSARPADTSEGAPPWAPGDDASEVGAAPRAAHEDHVSGQGPVAGGQVPVDSGQWAVDSERTVEGAPPWAPGDGASDEGAAPRAAHQGHVSGQWPVVSGQGAVADGQSATPPAASRQPSADADADPSPLRPMSVNERVIADYQGTGLTIGPHPMALKRRDLALRGVLRAVDLPQARSGRRVRVAGAVITRQRPGTAKGFCFLTLEDETGIANVIVRPDLFAAQRAVIVHEPFVIVEGVLQQQEGVTAVRAERVSAIAGASPPIESHDFH